MKSIIRDLIRRFGFDINYFGRSKIFRDLNIELLIDVGANEGQYAKSIRRIGYLGKICSFEPLHDAFLKLEKASKKDPLWDVYNYALGEDNYNSVINISSNSYSSSIMDMTDLHKSASFDSRYISKQNISIKRLDDFIENLSDNANNIFLKIDTQGFEKKVLQGSIESLRSISGIQLEVSLVELYKGEDIFIDIINFLDSLNFRVASFEPGFYNKQNGHFLQADLLFIAK